MSGFGRGLPSQKWMQNQVSQLNRFKEADSGIASKLESISQRAQKQKKDHRLRELRLKWWKTHEILVDTAETAKESYEAALSSLLVKGIIPKEEFEPHYSLKRISTEASELINQIRRLRISVRHSIIRTQSPLPGKRASAGKLPKDPREVKLVLDSTIQEVSESVQSLERSWHALDDETVPLMYKFGLRSSFLGGHLDDPPAEPYEKPNPEFLQACENHNVPIEEFQKEMREMDARFRTSLEETTQAYHRLLADGSASAADKENPAYLLDPPLIGFDSRQQLQAFTALYTEYSEPPRIDLPPSTLDEFFFRAKTELPRVNGKRQTTEGLRNKLQVYRHVLLLKRRRTTLYSDWLRNAGNLNTEMAAFLSEAIQKREEAIKKIQERHETDRIRDGWRLKLAQLKAIRQKEEEEQAVIAKKRKAEMEAQLRVAQQIHAKEEEAKKKAIAQFQRDRRREEAQRDSEARRRASEEHRARMSRLEHHRKRAEFREKLARDKREEEARRREVAQMELEEKMVRLAEFFVVGIRDKDRLVQDTRATMARRGEDKAGGVPGLKTLFPQFGYTQEQTFADRRFKLMHYLREANLDATAYGRKALAATTSQLTMRPDQRTTFDK